MKITMYDFILQIKAVTPVDRELLRIAKQSTLNTNTSPALQSIVKLWREGWYDNDVTGVIIEIKRILKLS